MRNILSILFLLSLVPSPSIAQIDVLETIKQLEAYDGMSTVVFVKEEGRGGIFIRSNLNVSDFGVFFRSRDGKGSWKRSFDESYGVSPVWWGAVGDGLHDDLDAINHATKYCLDNAAVLNFPSGVFRITKPWIIGSKFIDEKDIFSAAPWKDAKSLDAKAHGSSRRYAPVIVRGGANTCIYGDFATEQLTAIVYYGIKGNGFTDKPSSKNYNHEFTNISIYGKGCFDGKIPSLPKTVNNSNNQIGLLVVSSDKIQINNCDFIGLKYGLFFNTSYWGSVSNTSFELCSTGFFGVGYNANLLQNVYASFCTIGFDIIGNEICINSINSGRCETALRLRGKYNIINQMYFENSNLGKNNYQLVLGRGQDDPHYGKSSNSTGIIINACTITAHGRPSIYLEDDFRDLIINSGQINGEIKSVNSSNKVTIRNATGNFRMNGPGKLIRE